jgi:prostaglandin-H2 D-isomerase / glutathione transferase
MKLVYFNGRGLAETSRLLLELNKVDYEDFRYPLKVIDWKTHNMEKVEFTKDKESGKLLHSLNKLPFLEVNGKVIPQSKAIERYIASKYNMMGDNLEEAGRIDSICECVRDFKDEYQKVRKLPDEEKELGMDQWFSKTLVEKMILLDNLLGHEDEKYAVGTKISLADIVLFSFITQFFDKKELALSSTDNLKVKNIINNVNTLDEIKNWINKRPDTAF